MLKNIQILAQSADGGIGKVAQETNNIAITIISVFTGIVVLAILVLSVFVFVQNVGAPAEKRRENQKRLLWAAGGIIVIIVMWTIYGIVIAGVPTDPNALITKKSEILTLLKG